MPQRHAFLIIAHDAPEVLDLLLRNLDHPRVDIFLHIDARSTDMAEQFRTYALRHARYTLCTPSVSVYWGDVSQVKGELLLYATAAAQGPYAHYHLLSGVDMLLHPIDHVLRFFDTHPTHEFVGLWQGAYHQRDVLRKVNYHYPFMRHQRTLQGYKWLHKLTNPLRKGLPVLERFIGYQRYPNRHFCKGYNWCSLTQHAVDLLVAHHQALLYTYRMTLCPDEIYKPTLLGQTTTPHYFDTTDPNRGSQRYVDWQRGMPYTFQPEDLKELLAQPHCFARKCSVLLAQLLFEQIHAPHVPA